MAETRSQGEPLPDIPKRHKHASVLRELAQDVATHERRLAIATGKYPAVAKQHAARAKAYRAAFLDLLATHVPKPRAPKSDV